MVQMGNDKPKGCDPPLLDPGSGCMYFTFEILLGSARSTSIYKPVVDFNANLMESMEMDVIQFQWAAHSRAFGRTRPDLLQNRLCHRIQFQSIVKILFPVSPIHFVNIFISFTSVTHFDDGTRLFLSLSRLMCTRTPLSNRPFKCIPNRPPCSRGCECIGVSSSVVSIRAQVELNRESKIRPNQTTNKTDNTHTLTHTPARPLLTPYPVRIFNK